MNPINVVIAGTSLFLSAMNAWCLEFPNPILLGTRGTNAVSLIAVQGNDGIRPKAVSVEFGKHGQIIAMQAQFSKGADFDLIHSKLQTELNPVEPKRFGTNLVVWRVEPKRFALSINREEDGNVHLILRSIDKFILEGPNPQK